MGVKGIGKLIEPFHYSHLTRQVARQVAGPYGASATDFYRRGTPNYFSYRFLLTAGSAGSGRFAVRNSGLYNW